MIIIDQYQNRYEIVKGQLKQISGYDTGRRIKLSTLGNIIRRIGTKKTKYTSSKLGAIKYGTEFSKLEYGVQVRVQGTTFLSVGCVQFSGDNAKTLRKAALKSSKVLA